MDSGTFHYTEVYDAEASKRFDKAVVRSMWRDWTLYALEQSYRFAFACLLAVGAYAWLSGDPFDLFASIVGILAGCALGTFTATGKAMESAQDRREHASGSVLECTISDDGYSYKSPDGTLVHHPWQTMWLILEHADGLFIETSNGPISMDRKPLIDAGLEDLFLSRIQGSK